MRITIVMIVFLLLTGVLWAENPTGTVSGIVTNNELFEVWGSVLPFKASQGWVKNITLDPQYLFVRHKAESGHHGEKILQSERQHLGMLQGGYQFSTGEGEHGSPKFQITPAAGFATTGDHHGFSLSERSLYQLDKNWSIESHITMARVGGRTVIASEPIAGLCRKIKGPVTGLVGFDLDHVFGKTIAGLNPGIMYNRHHETTFGGGPLFEGHGVGWKVFASHRLF